MAPTSDAVRRSIAKSSNGLCKKAWELSTLCGAEVCFLCYPPGGATNRPVVWPEDRARVDDIIDRYLAASPDKKKPKHQTTFENSKPSGGGSSSANAIVRKGGANDKKAEIRKGKEKVVSGLELRLPCPDDKHALGSLVEALDSRLMKVREKIEMLDPSALRGPPEVMAPRRVKEFDFMQLRNAGEKMEMAEPDQDPSTLVLSRSVVAPHNYSIAGGASTSGGSRMEAPPVPPPAPWFNYYPIPWSWYYHRQNPRRQ